MAIEYPFKFTDIYNNNATLYGFQLDANFKVITSGLNSIVNSITNSTPNEFKLANNDFINGDDNLHVYTVNYSSKPLTEAYHGLKVSGMIHVYTGYQVLQGISLVVDDIPAYPLFIKNKLIKGQELGIPNPKNAIGNGYNSFTFDENLQGWLYEGDIPTGSLKFHTLTSRNEEGFVAQMENATGYLGLGGHNGRWENINPAEVEPFGFLIDANGDPIDYNGYVGAGLSSTYTPELGKTYLGLNTGTVTSQGSFRNAKLDNGNELVYSISGDLSREDRTGDYVTSLFGLAGGDKANILTLKPENADDDTTTKYWQGMIWLKL